MQNFLAKRTLKGQVCVIALGKAAISMAAGAADVLGSQIVDGLVVTRHGYVTDDHSVLDRFTIIESGHPFPDEASLEAGRQLLSVVQATPVNTRLLFLISGGTSSLIEVLPEGLSVNDLEALNRWLVGSGLPIHQINEIRKRVSIIKGGRLAKHVQAHPVLNLMISDVNDNDPATIGSGLLAANRQSVAVPELNDIPENLRALLEAGPEMPACDDACFGHIESHVIANLDEAMQSAAAYAENLGYEVTVHKDYVSGDVASVGEALSSYLRSAGNGLHIWGGETTVILPDNPGTGGRCQSLALTVANEIKGKSQLFFLAAGTDGSDGPGEDAGALVDGGTIDRGNGYSIDAKSCLQMADAGAFLAESGDLIFTGPTGTNVTDLFLGLKVDKAVNL